jgi:D-threo-aldose 1-dehydrogenase
MIDRLGLGGAPIGNLFAAVSDEDARATVDAAWDRGIRFFDTAPLYGHGLSERRLGTALAGRPRDEYTLATKVGRLLVAGDPGDTMFVDVPSARPVFDFSYDAVMRSLEDSLDRLGHDRVDILHVHDPDDHVEEALAGAFPALRRLRDEGVINKVGAGMNQAPALLRFVREAGVDCVLLAGRYTLLDQSGAELLDRCGREGVEVYAAGVFNSGLLADPRPGATYDYAAAPADLVARAKDLASRCDAAGVSLKAAALQFPLRHPAVTRVLMGARTGAEVEENVELFETAVPEDLWDELVPQPAPPP